MPYDLWMTGRLGYRSYPSKAYPAGAVRASGPTQTAFLLNDRVLADTCSRDVTRESMAEELIRRAARSARCH